MKVKLKTQYHTGKPRKDGTGKVVGVDETVRNTGETIDVDETEARRLLKNGYFAEPIDDAAKKLAEKMSTESSGPTPTAYTATSSQPAPTAEELAQKERDEAAAKEKAAAIQTAKATDPKKRTAEQNQLLSDNT